MANVAQELLGLTYEQRSVIFGSCAPYDFDEVEVSDEDWRDPLRFRQFVYRYLKK